MTDTSGHRPHVQCGRCGKYVELDEDCRMLQHAARFTDSECMNSREFVPRRLAFMADPADPQPPQAPVIPEADPTVEFITAEELGDEYWHEETMQRGRKAMAEQVPPRYRTATITVPEVATWVRGLIRSVDNDHRTAPRIDQGKSLLLLGPTGTGKTHQAYGVVRALSVCGVSAPWVFSTAADFYAKLRPRAHVDSEQEFEKFANACFLVIDDLGAAKGTEWNEEINYRLINHRYEHEKPTMITSNVPPKDLSEALGVRVASRLMEMTDRVVIKGGDRRIQPARGAA